MNLKTLTRYFILVGTLQLGLISCNKKRLGADDNSITKLDSNSIIKEGHGVDDFEIRTLTVGDVKKRLGYSFELIDHKGYSGELFYKQFGTSFYYKAEEPTKIFAISFNEHFKGKTTKGFSTKDMLVRDMLEIYGQPRWSFLVSAETLYAHYDSSGIYFAVKPRGEPPYWMLHYSLDDSIRIAKIYSYYDSAYNADKIIEISVGVPGTDF